MNRENVMDRLLKNRSIDDSTGCWNWTGAKRDSDKQFPYGVTRVEGGFYYVHRLVAHLYHDLDLGDRASCALHSCDNPSCFNPDHLRVGTQAENLLEMRSRGRNPYIGEKHWGAKLSESQVREIRIRSKTEATKSIAKSMNVSRSTVERAASGQTWGHVL